jgi:hypothetical protein
MTTQFLFTLATILPCKLFFEYMWLHALFLAAMVLSSIHNGAHFYIEVFSAKYNTMYPPPANRRSSSGHKSD